MNAEAFEVRDSACRDRPRSRRSTSVRAVAWSCTWLVFLGLLMPVAAEGVTFSDGTFDDGDWVGTEFPLGPTGGSASASQLAIGGNPDAYREIQATVNSTAGTGQNGSISLYSIRTLALYDPVTQGAIESVDFSIDAFQTTANSGGTVTAAILQDGTLFTASRGLAGPEMDWTPKEIGGLVQSEFLEIDSNGQGVSQPDFSSSGSPVTFGFRYVISTPVDGPAGSRTAGFDNWTITVNSIACAPAPLNGCLASSGAALSIAENKPGKEKLKLKLKGFMGATTAADFGDPVAGDTRYDVCVYDGAELVGELSVDRGAELCGSRQRRCWTSRRGRGYAYKDADASADGVRKLSASAGDAGKGKLDVMAANNVRRGQTALPTGIAHALQGATSATVQVVASDGLCFEAIASEVKRADGMRFQARARP